ncbi:DUF1232 domain-containing protein [Actinotalea sp. AC32]|nr:DUF1232 domain-containing protein [Actinotalea sp. AC32]
MSWWEAVVGGLVGLLLAWAALVVVLWRARPDAAGVREALRLLPDLVRLVRRLAGDKGLPRGVRVRLWLLVAYLASPVDLVPDVVPVLGYADDAVAVALTLRAVVRVAGPDALARHWPGTPDGLATVHRLVGLPRPEPSW